MISRVVTVKNPTGLHTRPGHKFMKVAASYASDITIKKGDKEANAKSLLKIMKIGISQGDNIIITCDGEDEQAALDGLEEFINTLTD